MTSAPHPCSWPDSQIEALGVVRQIPTVDQIMHVRSLGATLNAVFRSGDNYVRSPLPRAEPAQPES